MLSKEIKYGNNKTPPEDLCQAVAGFPDNQGYGNCGQLWKAGVGYKAVLAWFWKQGKFRMRFGFRDKVLQSNSFSTPCSEIISSQIRLRMRAPFSHPR